MNVRHYGKPYTRTDCSEAQDKIEIRRAKGTDLGFRGLYVTPTSEEWVGGMYQDVAEARHDLKGYGVRLVNRSGYPG